MKFKQVAKTFSLIEGTSARLEITELLADLLKKVTPQEASIISNLSLGQLNPPYIGTQFNIASKTMIKILAKLLKKDEKEIKTQAQKLGDLGLVAGQGDWQVSEDLTVHQVYDRLHEIEKVSGIGSTEEKINQLEKLLSDLTPEGAKFVVRIVLGKLRLGFSDMTLVDAFSWMEVGNKSLRSIIEDAYNVCADIGLIAQTIKEEKGINALKKMKVQIGIPIRLAAAERLPTAKDIFDKIGKCVAQQKLDGFRLQIHLDKTGKKPKLKFYSRNLQDMSFMFPDLAKELEKLNVKTLICEGEAIVFDQNAGQFLPFQETVKRKRKHDIEKVAQELPLQLFLFDLLYLNGEQLLDKTHAVRRHTMEQLLKGFKSENIKIVDEEEILAADQLEQYFLDAIDQGLEGLVVKRTQAEYKPGKRNFNWIKLKRSEGGRLEDTLDTVILGYYLGTGRRTALGIGALLVGVYNKKEDVFQTIAKVGTGLTDQEWKDVKKESDKYKVKEQPKNVICAKELFPDVWLSPELVCQVWADELSLSPRHSAGKTEKVIGFSLRFPRFMKLREDKGPYEATTVSEISRLYEDQFITKK